MSAKSVIAGELDARALSARVSDVGAAELLLDSAMRSLAASGVMCVTLGLSPLSRYSQWLRGGARADADEAVTCPSPLYTILRTAHH